jgi:hypothetical protein
VALSPQSNYTDWMTATCRRNLVPTFVDRGVSRGQRGGSPTVVNLSFLDRIKYRTVMYVFRMSFYSSFLLYVVGGDEPRHVSCFLLINHLLVLHFII